ncbi:MULTISPECIES: hypothetical protein [unclassified Streptomyces]|uniref:hypothetical protein n=1 Tax=unclassified Streptomyces TaxID=2593676 RepID=UPI00081B288D|nr:MULTISPECIES: hypothetical protein [unclassified Streptomyces]MEE1746169.1 hypothetical protein [Streptomyces sp. JV184]MYQ86356.1 hypothetical protein [Streptomyces sp. SID4936]SCE21086.1 hypothetical protein GA0115234_1068132 [Streptomyces sp. DvalAA-43]
MDTEHGSGFVPATGDGPMAPAPDGKRSASVRTAFEGMLQIRRLTNTGHADPQGVPAPWERHRPIRAVAIALESSGLAPSAVDGSGLRTAAGYRLGQGESPGGVRVEWLGPPGSGAAHAEEAELARCASVLRELGWTVLLYRGARRRRFLEVEPPAGARGPNDG